MKKDEFESAALELWMTTNVPMTQANLQYHTGQPRRRVRKWLDELVRDGVIELDSDDDGELCYIVPGGQRPANGPRTFDERDRLDALRGSVKSEFARKQALQKAMEAQAQAERDRELAALQAEQDAEADRDKPGLFDRVRGKVNPSTALSIANSTKGELDKGPEEGKKSLLVSGGLSLVFGPLGWLYAGSFREALPAAAVYLLAYAIIPTFLLLPLLGVAMPISGIAGLVYAWQYNRSGERGRILGDDDDKE